MNNLGSEEIKELTEEQQIAEVELRMAELNSPFGKNDHPLGMSVAAEKMLVFFFLLLIVLIKIIKIIIIF